MKPIGGFFEFEFSQGGTLYHQGAIPLSTGRACLNLIIQETKPKKIHVPFYVCDALLKPIIANHIPFEPVNVGEFLEQEPNYNPQKPEGLFSYP